MREPIILADRLRKQFANILLALRYFTARGQFSYLDRLASAMDPIVVRQTVYEALRSLRSAVNSAIKLKIKTEEGDIKEIVCLDYDVFDCQEDLKNSPAYMLSKQFRDVVSIGKVVKAPETRRDLINKYVICYTLSEKLPLPWPTDEEVAKFIDIVEKEGTRVSQIIASLAASGKVR